jgi:hypothetical protein
MRRSSFTADLKSVARAVNRQCVICCCYNGQPQQQQMANLPESRVYPSRPFLHCAVNCGGPVAYTAARLCVSATHDRYFLVCMCLSTHALYLKLLASLSASDLLLAFQAFSARSGTPQHIYLDRGTNFLKLLGLAKKTAGSTSDDFEIGWNTWVYLGIWLLPTLPVSMVVLKQLLNRSSAIYSGHINSTNLPPLN